MNAKVIRVLELAEDHALIGIDPRYENAGHYVDLDRLESEMQEPDEQALAYCRRKGWVAMQSESLPPAWPMVDVTRLVLTPAGETVLFEYRMQSGDPPAATPVVTTDLPIDDVNWPRQADVARRLAMTPMQLKRAIEAGELSTNGKSGRASRVDPASVLNYCNQHGLTYNET